MTKQELIYNLKNMISICDDVADLNRTYDNLNGWIELCKTGRYKENPPDYHFIRPGRVFCFILYVAVTIGIGFLIGLVLKWLLLDVFNNSVLHIISIVLESIVWLILTLGIYYNTYDIETSQHYKEQEDVETYNSQLTKAKNNYNQNVQRQQRVVEQIKAKQQQYCNCKDRIGGLHKKYCKRSTVNSLIDILEEGRADTLKEALNIYTADQREYDRDEAEREYRREQTELQRQILAEQQYQSDMAAQSARAAASLDELNRRESWREFERIIGIR